MNGCVAGSTLAALIVLRVDSAAADDATRGVTGARRQSPIDRYVEPRQLGILGEPRVNVFRLNVALDSAFTIRTKGAS